MKGLVLTFILIASFIWLPAQTERFPQFPGGQDSMNQFIKKNFNMPDSDWDDNAKNFSIKVGFYIDSSGNISQIRILKSGGSKFDNEAIRIIKLMPRWEPAILNSKPAGVNWDIPITIKIN
jgi:TonB family protein